MEHIKNIQAFLEQQHIDALFITSASNVTYASNFVARLSTEREAYVFITKNSAYILTSKLYLEEVKQQSTCIALELSIANPLSKQLKAIVEKEQLKKIGFEEENLTFAEYKKLSTNLQGLTPVDLYRIREKKDTAEIDKVAKACEIGDKAFTYILSEIKQGITEKELSLKLENFIRSKYADISFPTIVAFGKNAAVAHHETNKTILEKNQFVLIDFGVLYQNYCSDMTRTIFFGTPTEKQKYAYETVRISQEKAVEYIKSKVPATKTLHASEVDKVARDYIVSHGFPSFPHSLGHGIGIEVHEAPSLSPYSHDILTPGMVFSVEPGIYIDNELGIRIEDLVAITDSALLELTHAPKKFIQV